MNRSSKKTGVLAMPRLAIFVLVFGLLTVVSGASVLFGPESIRQVAGEVVKFVLWFNFMAGFLYLLAAVGLWRGRTWIVKLSGLIASLSLLVLLALLALIVSGGVFELRTLLAMSFRALFWAGIYLYTRQKLSLQ